VENALVAAEAEEVAAAMTIRVMHASRASRAGSFLVSWQQPDA
jgi:hypothetical protein